MLDYRTHTFLAVCKLGSFTRAAAELHITRRIAAHPPA